MTSNCGLPDGVIHLHSDRCYQAGRRDALTPQAAATTRCTWCHGRGTRVHGWALVAAKCRDCGGTGLAQPLAPALTTHVDLGAVWIERDGQQVRVDADELLPLVRSLLVHLDALGDAR